MEKIKKGFLAIGYISKLIVAYIVGHNKYQDIWLISERGFDARDNGFVFYKYLRTKHPEVNSYYIIDSNSPDYEKVKKYGNIVEYKSWQHYLLLANATYKISTHDQGYTPNMVIFHWLHKLAMKLPIQIKGKVVFLQHGIFKDNIPWYYRSECTPDIFTVSTEEEYQFVEKYFDQHDPELQLLGLCRYDNLIQKEPPKKQILLMPTWRKGVHSKEEFVKTTYYKKYNDLLKNETLQTFLKTNEYTLIFYPHIEFQPYLNTFNKCENVILANMEDYDVQKLLIESEILITDYSSVFFDFAYLNKPIYFYQFDQEYFFKNHYSRGYIDFSKIGIVTDNEQELINNVITCKKPNSSYVDTLFKYRDTNNCERTYKRIREL